MNPSFFYNLALRAIILSIVLFGTLFGQSVTVPLYRVFEREITNNKVYDNKFRDVTLNVQYQAPSGRLYHFYGFYDGDGRGNSEGKIWKIRFIPNETGQWTYEYTWSDESQSGRGILNCVAEGAGKGILQPYEKNKHWFAYNGTDPVWLKSYYETGHGSIGQNFDWIVENVYSNFINAGYNHLQVNWLLSLCCFGQYYKDGPEPETLDLFLYREGDLFGSMNLDVWQRMERHLGWLNDHDIGVHMFLGVDGSQNDGPDWSKLSFEEKDWFVKYIVARLAPYANLAGWNFVGEVPGNREDRELGFVRLIQKYNIFNHLRTYEDEMPKENEYDRPEYTFAAVENHGNLTNDRDSKRHLEKHPYKEPWTHHLACLVGYKGKPVFMSEGNALWRRFWQKRTNATQDDLRRSAWACATAGASFTWNGHAHEYELYVDGSDGSPFNEANPYMDSERAISILADVMKNEVTFYKMAPHDKLLADCPGLRVYLLAEPGAQYLAFTPEGLLFSIKIEKGTYSYVVWIDTKTGEKVIGKAISIKEEQETVSFNPPNRLTDWILIIRNEIPSCKNTD